MFIFFQRNIKISLWKTLPISNMKKLEEKLRVSGTSTSQYYFSLFYRTTEILPAAVRQWYTSLPRSAAVPFRKSADFFLNLSKFIFRPFLVSLAC